MNLRKLLIAATMIALAGCGVTKQEPTQQGAVAVEALTLAADITRVTVQLDATPEVNMTGSTTPGKYSWQNVNVTPGTYNFTFRAYKQVAGSGSFTLGGATLLAGDNVDGVVIQEGVDDRPSADAAVKIPVLFAQHVH